MDAVAVLFVLYSYSVELPQSAVVVVPELLPRMLSLAVDPADGVGRRRRRYSVLVLCRQRQGFQPQIECPERQQQTNLQRHTAAPSSGEACRVGEAVVGEVQREDASQMRSRPNAPAQHGAHIVHTSSLGDVKKRVRLLI